jgi:hypothetical protein
MTATIEKTLTIDLYAAALTIKDLWEQGQYLDQLTSGDVEIDALENTVTVLKEYTFTFLESGKIEATAERVTIGSREEPNDWYTEKLGTHDTIAAAVQAIDDFRKAEFHEGEFEKTEDDSYPEYDDEYTFDQYENDLDF